MLRLQWHDGGPEFDAGGTGAHQRDGQQCVEVVGHLGNPRGVHARGFGPLDVGKHLGDFARRITTLGADHYSETHGSSKVSLSVIDNVLAKKENANTVRLSSLNALLPAENLAVRNGKPAIWRGCPVPPRRRDLLEFGGGGHA